MDGKVAVVTGSSSGIGAATARLFARNGFNVVINYSRNSDQAEVVAEECRQAGSEALVVRCDVSENSDCRSMATGVVQKWGLVDALINNAATTKFASEDDLDALSAQDFYDIYAANVIGAYQIIRAFAPLMRKHLRAGVVNVSSMAAITRTGSSIAYVASKGALTGPGNPR